MYSSAVFCRDGKEIWSVVHKGEDGPDHLVAEGMLPAPFEKTSHEYRELQSNQDPADEFRTDYMFEVPLILAQEITGFKHDEVPEEEQQEETKELIVTAEWIPRKRGFPDR
jgi:hypothetical protein